MSDNYRLQVACDKQSSLNKAIDLVIDMDRWDSSPPVQFYGYVEKDGAIIFYTGYSRMGGFVQDHKGAVNFPVPMSVDFVKQMAWEWIQAKEMNTNDPWSDVDREKGFWLTANRSLDPDEVEEWWGRPGEVSLGLFAIKPFTTWYGK